MISIQIYIDAHTRQKNNSNNNIYFLLKKKNNWMVDWSLIYCCIFCSGCFLYKWHITYTSSSLIWSDQIMWFFLSLFGNNHTLLYTLYSRLIWSHRRSSSSSSWAIYILYNHLNRKKITNLIISNWICLKGQHT